VNHSKNHGREINDEELWRRNLRGIVEKESLRRDASWSHLGGTWEAPGSSQRLQEARGLQEAPNHKN